MTGKQRLSASVDAELLDAAQAAVDDGRAPSVSAWVNDALRLKTDLKTDHDRRMQALGSFLAAYEAEHGVITAAEMDNAEHRARSRATVVRSTPAKATKSHRGVA